MAGAAFWGARIILVYAEAWWWDTVCCEMPNAYSTSPRHSSPHIGPLPPESSLARGASVALPAGCAPRRAYAACRVLAHCSVCDAAHTGSGKNLGRIPASCVLTDVSGCSLTLCLWLSHRFRCHPVHESPSLLVAAPLPALHGRILITTAFGEPACFSRTAYCLRRGLGDRLLVP